MNIYRIFFSGAQGTGKTTQAMQFLKHYPEYHQVVFERRGLHKNGIISINKDISPWDEIIMGGDILKAFLKTPAPFISERSWIDKMAFAQASGLSEEIKDLFHKLFSVSFLPTTEMDRYFYFPISIDLVGDESRVPDKEYQKEVDYWIRFYLDYFDIDFHSVEAVGVQDRHLEIMSVLGGLSL